MTSDQLLIVLAAATVTVGGTAALRRRGFPTPVVLVVAGLIIGFLPFVPDFSLDPEVVLLGVLPLLVYEAGYNSSPRAFVRHSAAIALLAVGLVLLTAAAVAAVAHAVGHLSWPLSFVLGTAVAPTDALAATSIASRLGLPRALTAIIEGEALFNDATALVLYGSAVVAATSGRFSALDTLGRIGYGAVVGVVVGFGVAYAGRIVRGWLDDPPIEIAVSLLIAYLAYLPAEALGASGVLAAVTAGLYLGWTSSGSFSAGTRLQSTAFWDNLVFLVNAALFIFVGLSFHTFTSSARGPVGRLVLSGVAVAAAVIVVRMLWILLLGWVLRRAGAPGRAERIILGWSGMRGAVTLAAALAIPTLTSHGQPLAGRDDVIYLAYAVIIVTLIGQGLTLPVVVKAFGLRDPPHVAETERQARLTLATATLAHLHERGAPDELAEHAWESLRVQLEARIHRLEAPDAQTSRADQEAVLAAERLVREELLIFQRRMLLEMRGRGDIGSGVLRSIERDLDLEEARIR